VNIAYIFLDIVGQTKILFSLFLEIKTEQLTFRAITTGKSGHTSTASRPRVRLGLTVAFVLAFCLAATCTAQRSVHNLERVVQVVHSVVVVDVSDTAVERSCRDARMGELVGCTANLQRS
jgi:hypothetical protein